MNNIVFFLTEHWMLSGLFGLLLVALIANEWISQIWGAARVSPEEAIQWMNHKQAVVLDIRQPESFAEGHILGSINILPSQLEKKIGSLQKYQDKPLIIVGTVSQETGKVATLLKSQGYQSVILRGGIQEWRNAGLPLVKK